MIINSIKSINSNINSNAKSKINTSNRHEIAFEGDKKQNQKMVTIPLTTYMAMLSAVAGGAMMQSCSPVGEAPEVVIDFTDSISNSKVNLGVLDMLKKSGLPIVSSITPVSNMSYDDPKTNSSHSYIFKRDESSTKLLTYYKTTTDKESNNKSYSKVYMTLSKTGTVLIQNTQAQEDTIRKNDYLPIIDTKELKANEKGMSSVYDIDTEGNSQYQYFVFASPSADGAFILKKYYPDGTKESLTSFYIDQAKQ